MMMNGVLKTKRPETDGSFGRFAGLNTRREIWTSAGTRRNSFPAYRDGEFGEKCGMLRAEWVTESRTMGK